MLDDQCLRETLGGGGKKLSVLCVFFFFFPKKKRKPEFLRKTIRQTFHDCFCELQSTTLRLNQLISTAWSGLTSEGAKKLPSTFSLKKKKV